MNNLSLLLKSVHLSLNQKYKSFLPVNLCNCKFTTSYYTNEAILKNIQLTTVWKDLIINFAIVKMQILSTSSVPEMN